MQCPHCDKEVITVEAELEDSNADVISGTDVNISISFMLLCAACGEELGGFVLNNDQDIGDFVDAHPDHEFGVELHGERFSVLKSNGHTSVGAEATLRVVCEECSTSSDYEWSDYESLSTVLDEFEQ